MFVIPHMIEEVSYFKGFIEPYVRSGAHRLIKHMKAQRFRLYMHDNGIPTMQYKLLCMTQDWSPPEGLLVWCVDEESKTMLPDGEPKASKRIPMKNVEDIIKNISCFIQYWERLRVADVGGSFHHQYGIWIGYWTFVCFALSPDLHQDNSLMCRHDFWPQSHVHVLALEARLMENGEVREEFIEDDHWVGPASNHPHHIFMLQWIVTEVICSFCILKMSHKTNLGGKSYVSTIFL